MKQRHTVIPAVYVVFQKGTKVLLLKRANTGYRDGFYSMPAGHLNGGEPAIVAAAREAKEEIGVHVKLEDLEFAYLQHRMAEEGNHERMNLFFVAKSWQGEPYNKEPHKCDDLSWHDLNNLPKNLVPELVEFFKYFQTKDYYGHFGF